MNIFITDFKVMNGNAFNAGNMIEHVICNGRDGRVRYNFVGRFLPLTG